MSPTTGQCGGKEGPGWKPSYKLYDRRSVSASDLQQLALYAFANRDEEASTALLLHPTQHPIDDRTVIVRDRHGRVGSQIKIMGIQVEPTVRELAEPRLKQQTIRRMTNLLAASGGTPSAALQPSKT